MVCALKSSEGAKVVKEEKSWSLGLLSEDTNSSYSSFRGLGALLSNQAPLPPASWKQLQPAELAQPRE